MPVIAVCIEPRRAIRIFFDCRDVPAVPDDLRRIERAVEGSYTLAEEIEEAEAICSTAWSHLLGRIAPSFARPGGCDTEGKRPLGVQGGLEGE